MQRSMPFALILLAFLVDSSPQAEVISASPQGFTTRHQVSIAATRFEVYRVLTQDIGKWWNPDHTVSGNAEALYIDPRPLGCFCESLGADAGLVHMTVTFANPGVLLRLTGGLGPLGLMGTAGNMTFDIDESDGITSVVLQYTVGGYYADGLDSLAPAVDRVLVEQLDRLARYIDSGDPAAINDAAN